MAPPVFCARTRTPIVVRRTGEHEQLAVLCSSLLHVKRLGTHHASLASHSEVLYHEIQRFWLIKATRSGQLLAAWHCRSHAIISSKQTTADDTTSFWGILMMTMLPIHADDHFPLIRVLVWLTWSVSCVLVSMNRPRGTANDLCQHARQLS